MHDPIPAPYVSNGVYTNTHTRTLFVHTRPQRRDAALCLPVAACCVCACVCDDVCVSDFRASHFGCTKRARVCVCVWLLRALECALRRPQLRSFRRRWRVVFFWSPFLFLHSGGVLSQCACGSLCNWLCCHFDRLVQNGWVSAIGVSVFFGAIDVFRWFAAPFA